MHWHKDKQPCAPLPLVCLLSLYCFLGRNRMPLQQPRVSLPCLVIISLCSFSLSEELGRALVANPLEFPAKLPDADNQTQIHSK